jgi:hypothetical protein
MWTAEDALATRRFASVILTCLTPSDAAEYVRRSLWGTRKCLACDPVAVGVQPRHISVVGVVGAEPLLRVGPAAEVSAVHGVTVALLLVGGPVGGLQVQGVVGELEALFVAELLGALLSGV